MKNPNGYGTIKRLKGNRRKPFGVFITTGYKQAEIVDFTPLKGIITDELYQQVEQQVNDYYETTLPKYRQRQKALGYYETRQQALIALAEYNKRPYDVAFSDMTFEQAFEVVLRNYAEKLSDASIKSYIIGFEKCEKIKNMKMQDIKLHHLQAVLDSISHQSRSSQSNLIKVFHAVFAYAISNDIINKDYSQYVKITSKAIPKKKKPFTREEIKALWKDPAYYAPILVLIYTGLRISEYLNLTPSDIHTDRRIIEVHGTKTASAERLVPIHKDIVPLFQYELHLGYSYKTFIYNRFDRILATTGVHHTPHECRHTFATLAKEAGLDSYYVKRILGHISKDVTEDVYTHTFEDALLREIDKLVV